MNAAVARRDPASDGGDQQDKRHVEFNGWRRERYADYGKSNTFFR